MPSEISTEVPAGLGMAFCQTQAASAVCFGTKVIWGTVSMAGVKPITQRGGFFWQDFSKVLNKKLSVDDQDEVLVRVLHPGGNNTDPCGVGKSETAQLGQF